ncbi:hypothetical protein KY347_02265 [Candidatus Woesearchaeota archaeon]|nr:hypothetical protein [Candidatus Woesearchaeota archaeon]
MELTILAVTKRDYGVCIAGIGEKLSWVRPIKNRILVLDDIKLNRGVYLSNSCVYTVSAKKSGCKGHQSENYLIDEKEPISYLKKLGDAERNELFSKLSENLLITSNPNQGVCKLLKEKNRSLILLGPVTIDAVELSQDDNIHARIDFSIGQIKIKNQNFKSLPCTDFKFLSFSKDILKEQNTSYLRLDGNDLRDLLKVEKFFIALGLTAELYRGDYWPMVIGVHTIPDYTQEIDYSNFFPIEGGVLKKEVTAQSQEKKNILDPRLIDEYYKIKIELNRLLLKENELKEKLKTLMINEGISKYHAEKMDIFCRKCERIFYPKDKIEEFVSNDILEKIKSVKEIVYLLTRLKK